MNTNKDFPFMFQRTITTSDDIDNLPNGIYGVNSSFGASVNGVNYGVLSSFGNTSSSSGFRYQTLYNTASSQTGFYFRTKSDKGWNAWRTSDNFGYNTLAELSEGVASIFTSNKLWKIATYNQNGVDLNELSEDCMVYFTNGSNAPSGHTSGCCLQFTYGSAYKIQFYITNSFCYIRTYTSAGGWLAWTKIVG